MFGAVGADEIGQSTNRINLKRLPVGGYSGSGAASAKGDYDAQDCCCNHCNDGQNVSHLICINHQQGRSRRLFGVHPHANTALMFIY